MSAVLSEIESAEFFAPSNDDAVDVLVAQYRENRAHIQQVGEFMAGRDMQRAMGFFFKAQEARYRTFPDVGRIFDVEGAVKALDAHYWQRALETTDVLDFMPDGRRQEWFEQIREFKCPPFDEDVVRDNLQRLLAQRMDFLSEMVDGIFTGLSGLHVTNRPEGFSRRMIINNVFDAFGFRSFKMGLIQDLRSVIARFMGRDQPKYGETTKSLEFFRMDHGVWYPMDGGALRVRAYKKGTAHLEVHPEMAYRLNQILAHLHPMAIPPAHRQRPTKRNTKVVKLFERPIPFAVLAVIREGMRGCYGRYHRGNTFAFVSTNGADKHVMAEAHGVLAALGGVQSAFNRREYEFPYSVTDVLEEVLASGMLPDTRSYQYYPTPATIAREVIARADIGAEHRCLEPSAGQGGLLDLMPAERSIGVEVSELHCQVLEAKGHTVVCADFLDWKPESAFDRICMNPPYSVGRAQQHLEHAATMLGAGGRLVCVLPASFQGKDVLPGMKLTWSQVYENEFSGTSIDVVILVAENH